MLKRDIVIIIFLILLIVIFATQNAEVMLVHLWFFKFKSPVSLVILGALILGAFITWVFMIQDLRKGKKTIKEKNDIIEELKDELASKDPFKIDI